MSEQWHGGKGSRRRPTAIEAKELELREALWREKDETKKATIRAALQELRNR